MRFLSFCYQVSISCCSFVINFGSDLFNKADLCVLSGIRLSFLLFLNLGAGMTNDFALKSSFLTVGFGLSLSIETFDS